MVEYQHELVGAGKVLAAHRYLAEVSTGFLVEGSHGEGRHGKGSHGEGSHGEGSHGEGSHVEGSHVEGTLASQ